MSIGRTCRLVLFTCLASLALVYCSDDDGLLPESTLEPRPARPTATVTEEPPGPTFLTDEEFKSLLTVEDIKPVLQEQVDLKVTQFIDLKQVLAERNVQQMFPLDSGFSIFFVDADETKSIRLGVFDMKSLVDATNHRERLRGGEGEHRARAGGHVTPDRERLIRDGSECRRDRLECNLP